MKRFDSRQVSEAVSYSMQGGQALHVHSFTMGHPLFKHYPKIAHLFDQDRQRLTKTARRLGVRRIKVEYDGQPKQHIDLCGNPFERACKEAEEANH